MHDDFPVSFSQTFHVRYDECGPGGALRAAAHLRLFQELAWGHSAARGFPLQWYEQQRLSWVLRRVHLVVHARAEYGDVLRYTTRVEGARRVMARRANTARRAADGALIATCIADWIFTSEGSRPSRIHGDLTAAFPAMTRTVRPVPLPEAAEPQTLARTPVHIRVGDLDGMGHANNSVYFDLLDDAVSRAGGRAAVDAHPRTYDVQYEAATTADDLLQDAAWRDGRVWHYHLEGRDGGLVLRGRLTDGEIPY